MSVLKSPERSTSAKPAWRAPNSIWAMGSSAEKVRRIASVSAMASSPAAGAGLKSGDVILSVGGKPVASFRDLARLVAGLRNGETAKIGIVRDGKEMTLEAKITGQP